MFLSSLLPLPKKNNPRVTDTKRHSLIHTDIYFLYKN